MATVFSLTGKKLENLTGQQGLVFRALSELSNATIEQITDHIKVNGLKTVQNPERIAAYYVCLLKKSGHVTTSDSPAEESIETLVKLRDFYESKLDEVIAKIEAITVPQA
jgi:hypothetical protein